MTAQIRDTEDILSYTRYFFVDYENVNTVGLNGIVKLTSNDCVRIYYSSAAETMTFGLHRRICTSTCHFDYIKIEMPIKNAVDCQILFDIRDLLKLGAKAEYIIISKDKDFDKPIDFFKSQKCNISRAEEICKGTIEIDSSKTNTANASITSEIKCEQDKQDNNKLEAKLRSYFGQHFKKKIYADNKEIILGAILQAKSKQELKDKLLEVFQDTQITLICSRLNEFIKNLPEQ